MWFYCHQYGRTVTTQRNSFHFKEATRLVLLLVKFCLGRPKCNSTTKHLKSMNLSSGCPHHYCTFWLLQVSICILKLLKVILGNTGNHYMKKWRDENGLRLQHHYCILYKSIQGLIFHWDKTDSYDKVCVTLFKHLKYFKICLWTHSWPKHCFISLLSQSLLPLTQSSWIMIPDTPVANQLAESKPIFQWRHWQALCKCCHSFACQQAAEWYPHIWLSLGHVMSLWFDLSSHELHQLHIIS